MCNTHHLSALDLTGMARHKADAKKVIFQHMLKYLPPDKYNEVINSTATDRQSICIVFNPLGGIHQKYHLSVTSGFISTFKKISPDDWHPRMEYVLHFAFLTLLCKPNASLLDLKKLLTSADMRTEALSYVSSQQVFDFWYRDFYTYPPQHQTETINKIVAKIAPLIISAPTNTVDEQ